MFRIALFLISLSLSLCLSLVQSLLATRVISSLRAKAHKSESARIVSLRKLAHLLCGDASPRSLLAAEAAAQRLAASGEGCVVDAGAGIRVRCHCCSCCYYSWGLLLSLFCDADALCNLCVTCMLLFILPIFSF